MDRNSNTVIYIAILIFGLSALFQTSPDPQETNGCFWDRDSLATEASGFPGLTEIITGRFDRFPDLYYEMRIERVTPELEANPNALDLYDDIAVANDRIGNHTIAIELMGKKREQLAALEADGRADSEHKYRYLANLGTFYIHRWLSNGADQENLDDVRESHRLIEAAITLNPDAHFGRERYQLLAIQWILDGYSQNEDSHRQPTILDSIDTYRDSVARFRLEGIGYDDAIEGFSGLIVLGNAWESVDIYYALALAFQDKEHSSLELLSRLRVKELIEKDRRSLAPEFDHSVYTDQKIFAPIHDFRYDEIVNNYYPAARKEADERSERRETYILERLDRNEHPDTHPEFWANWIETTSPPSLHSSPFWNTPIFVITITLIVLGLVFFVSFYLVFRLIKRVLPKRV